MIEKPIQQTQETTQVNKEAEMIKKRTTWARSSRRLRWLPRWSRDDGRQALALWATKRNPITQELTQSSKSTLILRKREQTFVARTRVGGGEEDELEEEAEDEEDQGNAVAAKEWEQGRHEDRARSAMAEIPWFPRLRNPALQSGQEQRREKPARSSFYSAHWRAF